MDNLDKKLHIIKLKRDIFYYLFNYIKNNKIGKYEDEDFIMLFNNNINIFVYDKKIDYFFINSDIIKFNIIRENKKDYIKITEFFLQLF